MYERRRRDLRVSAQACREGNCVSEGVCMTQNRSGGSAFAAGGPDEPNNSNMNMVPLIRIGQEDRMYEHRQRDLRVSAQASREGNRVSEARSEGRCASKQGGELHVGATVWVKDFDGGLGRCIAVDVWHGIGVGDRFLRQVAQTNQTTASTSGARCNLQPSAGVSMDKPQILTQNIQNSLEKPLLYVDGVLRGLG
ncbi:uncharacterized protein EI90DRAFT_3013744 [Cantharellus anzutake]|uniref:uncharacterized protein n=1 Tax=Cantharellus anzutake TaxID=1750568 RepID=UPI001906D64A|nr:uncharacterized protein EI90DRAFT_3013744 [Cantharellus anzutake]KAF8337553.1 hypothetical protein EI90DRAFT_3013744 [Cantharellus anzutake]